MRILTLALATSLLAGSAFAKYYEANRYDVTLHLDPQGGLTVTETAVFRFAAGPFTYVYRDIAATNTDGIDQVQAWIGGRPCAVGTGPGEVEIRGTSPVVVRWHFAPIMSGTETFTVQYHAAGTIRSTADSQALLWRTLPPKRSYRIGSAEIVLEYPPAIAPRSVELRQPGPDFEIGRDRASVTLVNPPAGSDAILSAQFPVGSFTGPPPEWLRAQERMEQDRVRGIQTGGVVAAVLLVLACVWMFRVRAFASLAAADPQPDAIIQSPPDSLQPALAGWLIGKAGLTLGTLLDLARRGVLRIEETRKGFGGVRHFQVIRCERLPQAAVHEQVLLESAFPDGQTTVALQTFLTRRPSAFSASIRSQLLGAGLLDQGRLAARSQLLSAGGLGLATGLALILIGVAGFARQAPLIATVASMAGASIGLAALLALTLGVIQRVWSEGGALQAYQWRAFDRYLTQVARGRAALLNPEALERFLPYAAAFGSLVLLLRRQAREGGLVLPAWFQAIQTADGSDSSSFLAFSSACDASTSSSGGGDGGGGGASGGGSSGAG